MLIPCRSLSLPSRERGLKFLRDHIHIDSLRVAPLAGAWIEIVTILFVLAIFPSLPSRERGLKSIGFLDNFLDIVSLPSRERGLKSVPMILL